MTKRGSDQVGFILMDGFDLLGTSTEMEDNVEAFLQEGHTFGDDWTKQLYTGVKKATFSQGGWYDDASASSNQALSGQEGVSRSLCYGIEGNVIGRGFIGYNGAMQVNYTRIASRGELHRANSAYEGNGQVDIGKILHPHIKMIGNGNTEATPVTNAAGRTTAGGIGYLQVSQLDLKDHTSVTVTIRQSDDGGTTWGNLQAFTAITSVMAVDRIAERIVVTGDVEEDLAVSVAFAGGAAADAEITFMVGFARN